MLAVIVNEYDPPVAAAGVPLSVAVPLPLLVNVTPAGSAPLSVIVATVGDPLVVTMNVPAFPTVKVVAFVLVIAGAWVTVSVKDCVESGATPLLAVIVNEYDPPVATAGVPLSVGDQFL